MTAPATSESASEWSTGGCHCGAVRFRVRIRDRRINECNCSICSKKGFLGLIVEAEDFVLDRGSENLSSYRFNTQTAVHAFCRVCGIHSFSQPRSHPEGFDVNTRCLDEWPEAGRSKWEIHPFDGQNWEDSVEGIRNRKP